ncbi:hypothetical protein [Burkholderia multivorans]|uniref:hypothetical protein n=1 Tax=Burkholderia multivorans TaxID=87883 RepID=UPI000CFF1EC8|nr:hypothetical protein [Burkholderia multivorans]MDR8747195.1 hypothetical protein [Burkholderia multivorans]MDR8806084.1 hypothetical protein [Burkholderia multivorans]PRH24744.1 hypothetical protein C6T71_13915 [Burkholderia multivorans]
MAKRELSADFRRGVAIANGALCRWKLSAQADIRRTKHMPEEFYASLADETGDIQRGMIECFAAFIRVVIEGSIPILGNWDPLEELEDADELYGDSEVDDD